MYKGAVDLVGPVNCHKIISKIRRNTTGLSFRFLSKVEQWHGAVTKLVQHL